MNQDEFKAKERERHRLYRLTHQSKIKAYRKKRYAEHKEEEKQYREEHKEEHVIYCRKWNETHRENRQQSGKKYYLENKEKLSLYQQNYKIKHPEVRKAHQIANQYCKIGDCCELCPEDDVRTENLVKHHPDYDFPEMFITCCQSCHLWIHKHEVEI